MVDTDDLVAALKEALLKAELHRIMYEKVLAELTALKAEKSNG